MTRPRSWPALALCCALLTAGCTSSTGSPESDPSPGATATAAAKPALRYVALGDSFTAAPGVADTDRSDSCLRSTENYPALVAAGLAPSRDVTLVDRSCVGADTTDLAGRQHFGGDTLPPQLDALSRGTDLVTLSMGGNDFGVFVKIVAGCLSLADEDPAGSPCRDHAEALGPLDEALAEIEDRLVAAVHAIEDRSPRADVLLVGYPQLAPPEGTCRERLPLADGDLPFARQVNRALTESVRQAAQRADATYVDVWAASAGHDICSAVPWVNGQQPVAGGAIPFHPLPAGQQAVADLVLDAVGPTR